MSIDIVIPSTGNPHNLSRILESITLQSLRSYHVIVVCNGDTYDEHQVQGVLGRYQSILTYVSMRKQHISYNHAGPSAGRMIGLQYARADYIYLIDDDNTFDQDFLSNTLASYCRFVCDYPALFICPVVLYRQTSLIQSVGFSHFSYVQARSIPLLPALQTSLGGKVYGLSKGAWYPSLIGGNSLFGLKKDFEKVGFDMKIQATMEDIDRSQRATNLGYQLVVPADLSIQHHERDKTILEKKFVSNASMVYHKTYNRIQFVKKYADIVQKCTFFILGLPLVSLYTVLMMLIYLPCTMRYSYMTALFRGLKDGIGEP